MVNENQLLKALDILDKVQEKYNIPFDKDNEAESANYGES